MKLTDEELNLHFLLFFILYLFGGGYMYNIGEVSEKYGIPVSTLRYYDKEGLFPNLKKKSGIRKFSDEDLLSLDIIACLKCSGMEIREIKLFMDMCREGDASLKDRRALIGKAKKRIDDEMERLKHVQDMLLFKSWYYDTAVKDGTEKNVKAMIPNGFPKEIQRLYESGKKKN